MQGYNTDAYSLMLLEAALARLMSTGGLLTKRQMEILAYIAEGYHAKEIASLLGVSKKTVDFHRYEIEQRLNVKGTALLVRAAIQRGWVRP